MPLVFSTPCWSQVFNSSAEGKNTIIVDGASFGFDLKETTLGFSYNNYFSQAPKKSRFLAGVNVTGKNTGGISNLFSSGNIVPASSLTGLLGFSRSNHSGIPARSSHYQKLLQEKNALDKEYITKLVVIFDSIKTPEVKAVFTKLQYRDSLLVDSLQKLTVNIAAKKEVREDAKTSLTKLMVIYKAYYLPGYEIDKQLKKLNEQQTKANYWRFVSYTDFGINSQSFKYIKTIDTNNLASSFSKEKFRGGFVGVGVNFQYRGGFIIGGKYTYMETNNLSSLELTKYTLTTENSNATQTLKTETEIQAYGPGYKRYAQHQWSTDLMFIQPVNDSLNFIFDVYGKYNRRANDTIQSLNIGISWFSFKPAGKFIGGLYVELPDALGQMEEDLPIEDQREWYNRISFGVVARFNLTTMGEYFYGK